jgi:hypothetical protein
MMPEDFASSMNEVTPRSVPLSAPAARIVTPHPAERIVASSKRTQTWG